jgi:hypothetical protein
VRTFRNFEKIGLETIKREKMKIIIMPDEPQKEYGIYGNIVSQKDDPDILKTSQESIQDRFCMEDDEGSNDASK